MISQREASNKSSTRIVKVQSEYQLCICVGYHVWGSKTNRLQEWEVGDRVLFEVGSDSKSTGFAALATVSGISFFHNPSLLWDQDEYPYRVPLVFESYIPPTERAECTAEIKKVLNEQIGPSWGTHVRDQSALPSRSGSDCIQKIRRYPNLLGLLMSKIGPMMSATWAESHGDEAKGDNPHGQDIESIMRPKWREGFLNPNPNCPACGSRNTRQLYYGTIDNPDDAISAGYNIWGGGCSVGATYACFTCRHEWF